MNFISIKTENNEYNIDLFKRKKSFSFDNNKYSQYICTIRFKDSMNRTILDINCNEKELYDAIQSLNEFYLNLGCIVSDNIYFNTNGSMVDFFMFLAYENYCQFPEEEDIVSITIFENTIHGCISRLSFFMSYYGLEYIIYNFYLLLEDIPYLDEINNKCLREYMECIINNLPD